MKEAWRRLKPLIFVQTYRQSDILIDRFLTSMASSGGLSLLFIAQQINGSINLVSNKASSAPMVPLLARAAKSDDWLGYKLIYRRRILWVLMLTSFGFLSLLFAGWPTLHILIGHGGLTEANVRSLWWILVALAGMLVGGASGQVATVALYTMGNTMTPSKLYILTYTIFIPIKVLAFMYFGIGGLAVSISVFFGLNFLLQFFTIEKELTLLINSEAERLSRREVGVTQDSQLDREQNPRLIEGFVD
jgi:peptidoglycan biosynthesis protein MviN/MurJ (putative lipid II flippase)